MTQQAGFVLHLGDYSSESDDEAIVSQIKGLLPGENPRWWYPPSADFSWEEAGDRSASRSDMRHKMTMLQQELMKIDMEERQILRDSNAAERKAVEHFLSQGSAIVGAVAAEQASLDATLRASFKQRYAKYDESVKAVEKEAEQARIAELERRQREEQERLRQEEEDRIRKEEADRIRKEEADRIRDQEEERNRKKQMEEERQMQAKKAEAELIRKTTKAALEVCQELQVFLETYLDSFSSFTDDKSMKDARRGIKKFVTLSVQQISATQEQVQKKSTGLIQFISQQHELQQKFALYTLASKLLVQCEVQITRLHSFAFPLGAVAVSVGRQFPDFLRVLVALIQRECPLGIPLVYSRRDGSSPQTLDYYEKMRFKVEGGHQVESEDDYVQRLEGYIRFYAAILQNDHAPPNFDIQHSWVYMASLLNHIPASRMSASAIDAFLSIAGYKMQMTFKTQFQKMQSYIQGSFLEDLAKAKDPNATAVGTRLQTYIQLKQSGVVPKGRNMPLRDESSYSRA